MQKRRWVVSGLILIVVGVVIGLVLGSGLNLTTKIQAHTPEQPALNEPASPPQSQSEVTGKEALRALSTAFADVAEKVNPSVVTIFTTTVIKQRQLLSPFEEFFGEDDFFRRFFQIPAPQGDLVQRGLGSGVIVSSDGIILTNNHVIKDADDINVRLMDGREFKAEVKGTDPKTDLAVIKIDAKDLPTIKFGDSDAVRVGEWVLAIGSPLQPQLAHTVTAGIVSAKGRSGVGLTTYEDYIQTDAAINPGNSGGALVNLEGELIGINTAIATRTGGYMGIGFAIPSNLAKKVMTDILEKGRVVRGWLGVYIQNVSPELAESFGLEKPEGVVITEVQENSPAEKAGLKPEDIIVEFNGKKVKNVIELSTWVAATEPGTEVKLKILRNGDEKVITVKLGELPAEVAQAETSKKAVMEDIGVQVENLTSELRQQFNLDRNDKGVVVVQVAPGSIAQQAGLRVGDLIMKVNRKPVENVDEFNRIVSKLKPGDSVAFFIKRGDQKLFIAFTIPKK